MPMIVETILTTRDAAGTVHVAPLGLIAEGEYWVAAPFRPSRTLDNLRAHPFLVANHVDDVRVFAGCLTGRRDFAHAPLPGFPGAVLEASASHWELAVERAVEDEQRPRFVCRCDRVVAHRPFAGFNRAQGAVIEACILVSRLHMLPPEKVEGEIDYLSIAIAKTAGPREEEAWAWLMERVERWRTESA